MDAGGRVYIKQEATAFPEIDLAGEIRYLVSMLRRAQVRLGDTTLQAWLSIDNIRGGLPG